MRGKQSDSDPKESNKTFETYEEYVMQREQISDYTRIIVLSLRAIPPLDEQERHDMLNDAMARFDGSWHKIPCGRGQHTYIRQTVFHLLYDRNKPFFQFVYIVTKPNVPIDDLLPPSKMKMGKDGYRNVFEGWLPRSRIERLDCDERVVRVIVLIGGFVPLDNPQDDTGDDGKFSNEPSTAIDPAKRSQFWQDVDSALNEIAEKLDRAVTAFRLRVLEKQAVSEVASKLGVCRHTVSNDVRECYAALRRYPELREYAF